MNERDNWIIKYFCELKICSWQRFIEKLRNEHWQLIDGADAPQPPPLPLGLIKAKRYPRIRMQAETNAQALKTLSYPISKNMPKSLNFSILLPICFSQFRTQKFKFSQIIPLLRGPVVSQADSYHKHLTQFASSTLLRCPFTIFYNLIPLQTEALLALLSSILQHNDIGGYSAFGIPYF